MCDCEATEKAAALESLRRQYPRNEWAAALGLDTAVVLKRGPHEIMFFSSAREADAWTLHVYGSTPWPARTAGVTHHEMIEGVRRPITEKLTIEPIKARGPRAGDLLIYLDPGPYYHQGTAIIDHSYGADTLSCVFGASAFREHHHLSCSGGPVPILDRDHLVYDGIRPARFWRWHNGYPGAGEGGDYTMQVPSWRWDGVVGAFGDN